MIAPTAFQRGGAAAGEARLGNTANSSSALFSVPRERRFKLRLKAKRYADRTGVNRTSSELMPDGTYRNVVASMAARDDRMLACGWRARSGKDVGIVYDDESGIAGFSNVQSCGSVWACPVCAAKIAASRTRDLEQVLNWAREQGHTIALVTMTVRHDRSQPLATWSSYVDDNGDIQDVPSRISDTGEVVTGVWDAVSAGWAAVTSGSDWASESVDKYRERRDNWDFRRVEALAGRGRNPRGGRGYNEALEAGDFSLAESFAPQRRVGDQEKYGILGWARATEVTDGENGWHVHIHAVMVLEGSPDQATLNAFTAGRSMWERWERGIKSEGFTAVRDSGGLDIRVARAAEKRLAEYLNKDGLSDHDKEHITNSFHKASLDTAKEATLGNVSKKAKGGGLTPFQILEAIDQDALEEGSTHPGFARASRYFARWREWIRGSEGRRQLTWSDNLRKLAKLGKEQDDQTIVDEAPAGETIVTLTAEGWRALRNVSWEPLTIIERHGVAALYDYLNATGIGYEIPQPQHVD